MRPRGQPDWTSVKAIAMKALASGGRMTNRTTVEWNIARRCAQPVWLHLWARSDNEESLQVFDTAWYNATEPKPAWRRRSDFRMNVEMHVPCRKCPPCLKDRGREWAMRAQSELRASHRTWFGTLTVEPEKHYMFASRARVRLANEKSTDFDTLPEAERFKQVEREYNRELQLMWKRLRKAGHKFRFIVVCESSPDHQSGLPHYHCLIHELSDPIKHRDLAGRRADSKRGVDYVPPAWLHGFSKFKLVDASHAKAAWYVCKYLTKDARVRVRASKSYGREAVQPPATGCDLAPHSLKE